MSYSEYTWQTGETITAEKLNHMEEGIADASSGSVVQKIKLGTANGYCSELGYANLSHFSGGGVFDEDKTLFDIVGSKQIIGIECQYVATTPGVAQPWFFQPINAGATWDRVQKSLIGASDSDKQEIISLSIDGLLYYMSTGSASVDVYAICI